MNSALNTQKQTLTLEIAKKLKNYSRRSLKNCIEILSNSRDDSKINRHYRNAKIGNPKSERRP